MRSNVRKPHKDSCLLVAVKDNRKCSFFLAVLMVSLFITNCSDVIIGFSGGTFNLNSVSLCLKMVCGLAFLYALPASLRRFSTAKLVLVFASVLVVLVNLLVFDIDQFSDTIFTYYTMCFTGFFVAEGINDYIILKKYLVAASRIVSYCAMIVLIISVTGYNTTLNNSGYRMGLGYACITCVMFLMGEFVDERRIRDFVSIVVLLLLILLYGSRGPMFGIAIFVVFVGFKRLYERKQYVLFVALLLSVTICVLFVDDIVYFANRLLEDNGISSRTLTLLANRELGYDAGRNRIWEVIVSEIQKHPFRIRGINAEYEIVGVYAHNLIIELIYQHGLILGSVAIVYILCQVVRSWRFGRFGDESEIRHIYMFASIPSLMFSGSVWTNQNFWIWLAFSIAIKHDTHDDSSP